VTALSIIGYILLGAVKFVAMLAILCAVIAALAFGTEYVIMPIARRTPNWVLAAWTLFWRGLIIVFGVSFMAFVLYNIGVGPGL